MVTPLWLLPRASVGSGLLHFTEGRGVWGSSVTHGSFMGVLASVWPLTSGWSFVGGGS
jgi:hypothetical protein